MSLKIRLARGGAKKRPFYRIVIADSRMPRDGRYIEKIGYHNPMVPKGHPERVVIDLERAKHWMSNGAKPSDRVARILDDAGVVKRSYNEQPKKSEPGEKAKERAEAKVEKAAAAAEAAKEAEEAAKAAAAEAAAAAAEAPAEEAPAEEAPAEEATAEEATAEEKAE